MEKNCVSNTFLTVETLIENPFPLLFTIQKLNVYPKLIINIKYLFYQYGTLDPLPNETTQKI